MLCVRHWFPLRPRHNPKVRRFISGMLDNLDLQSCLMRANAIGALQVMAPGDMDGLPTFDQLDAFLFSQEKLA